MTSFFKKSLTMQHPHLDTRVSPLRQRLLNATKPRTSPRASEWGRR